MLTRFTRACFGTVKVTRNNKFSQLTPEDITAFESMIGNRNHVVTDPDQIEQHNYDWTKKFHGSSKLLLKPSTTE